MLRIGEKSTVPLSKTRSPLRSRFAVRAALDMKALLAEKFRPRRAATLGSEASERMYPTLVPFFICPRYSGTVIVPLSRSIGPDWSNWTGPTRLSFVAEGGGPKYERLNAVPTDGGAGNRLQPGPGPNGPGPGPCDMLGFVSAPGAAISAGFLRSIPPSKALRGVRNRGESCAMAVRHSVIAVAVATVREIRRTFRYLQFK